MEKSAGAVTVLRHQKETKNRIENLEALIYASAIFTFSVLLLVIGHVLVRGVPHLKPSLFEVSTIQRTSPCYRHHKHGDDDPGDADLCSHRRLTSIYLVEYAKTDNLFVVRPLDDANAPREFSSSSVYSECCFCHFPRLEVFHAREHHDDDDYDASLDHPRRRSSEVVRRAAW